MRFRGRVIKDGKFWVIEVPILFAYTQGFTKKEAYEMIVDLVETMVDKPGFKAEVYPGKDGWFELGANDVGRLFAFMLQRQRLKNGLTLADMAERLGAKSRNAYARYEKGTSVPTIEKLGELLKAVSPNEEFVLIISES
jgi:DNA-binding XRE family transcriptional regulator